MDICFVTAELSPLAKVGGLADVSSALPSALGRAGHRLTVIVPFYRDLKIDQIRANWIRDRGYFDDGWNGRMFGVGHTAPIGPGIFIKQIDQQIRGR